MAPPYEVFEEQKVVEILPNIKGLELYGKVVDLKRVQFLSFFMPVTLTGLKFTLLCKLPPLEFTSVSRFLLIVGGYPH